MQVITTHLNADFDGLASMIAAQKLYPGAIMCFPGSQEKNLREFASHTLLYRYDFVRPKDIDIAKISTLVVVDTRSSERIGNFQQCLDNPATSIHLYDHHPQSPGDLQGELEKIRNVGATTTIFCQLLQKQKVELTAEEATILCLGIYEDTGSLTHLTTTPEDLEAAAWLVGQGAKLDVVAQFLSHELTSHQVEILHDLMNCAHQYMIQNLPITVVSMSLPAYVDEFALIVRRFMNMENLDTLFALISMGSRIYLIARSRIPEVNVGIIAREMGGGGHATAASATVKDVSLVEAQEKLVQILQKHIRPQPIASELMSTPAITIPADISLTNASLLLNRYSINSVVVVDPSISGKLSPSAKSVIGIITRQVIEKALQHKLGDLLVEEYMSSDINTLQPDATLADIQELIIESHQRLIPILKDERLIGVITRTDLLNHLVNDPAHLPKNLLHESDYPSLERKRNLGNLIVECLGRSTIRLLQDIGEIADTLAYNAYAVGGFVRDLLLKKQNLDLDIVVEGDGIIFAKELTKKLGGRYRTHERFSTASVTLPNNFKLDIATARLEYYEYPAALPTVELSSIKLDLYRRDFSINAMAIQLNPAQFGMLIDFFNCQNDLKHKQIKVLHNLSFVEDPSRLFRAVRFEQRMDFSIAPHTKRLIRNAVKMKLFGKSTDTRLFSEIRIILSENNPIPAIERLAEFELFQFLWPDLKPHLKVDRRFTHIMNQAKNALSWHKLLYLDEECERWMVYLLAIMGRSPITVLKSFCIRFLVPPKTTDFLLHQKNHADKIAHHLRRRNSIPDSETYWLFQELNIEGLLYLMAISRKSSVKRCVSSYVTDLRHTTTLLNGSDLTQLGYRPGPEFRVMLNELLEARLDNRIETREDELALLAEKFPLAEKG